MEKEDLYRQGTSVALEWVDSKLDSPFFFVYDSFFVSS